MAVTPLHCCQDNYPTGRFIMKAGLVLLGLLTAATWLQAGSSKAKDRDRPGKQDRGSVEPELEYVVDKPGGGYTALFGYRNTHSGKVTIGIGKNNRFTPQPQDRGQPREFLPGRQKSVFTVDFAHGSAVWHLDGKSASASPNRRPTVQLTKPGGNLVIASPGRLTLQARASDRDGKITQVKFFQNGVKIGRDNREPFTHEVRGLTPGSYSFKAVAEDNRGAPSLDSNIASVTVTGGNQPPTVVLTTPAEGATFIAPATIPIVASASDSDGSVAKVEFFVDGIKLGEDSNVPYEWFWSATVTGTYALSAVATDNQGGGVASNAVLITVQAATALPVIANFEPAEGYIAGPLDGQLGWGTTGSVNVVPAPVFAGMQSVQLQAENPPAVAERAFSAAAGSIVYLDFFMLPAAGDTPESAALIQTNEARVALVRQETQGEIQLWAGDDADGGQWLGTGSMIALNASGTTAGWHRFTMREDFGTRTWDFYAGGVMLAANLGFAGSAGESFSDFTLTGHTVSPTALDDFLAAYDNPLFIDADNDGMEDAWELAHGLNPTLNDRDGDLDGDGLGNITEYVLGTNPNDSDSDGDGLTDQQEVTLGTNPRNADSDADGLPDGWENAHNLNPLSATDATLDPDGDGLSHLAEFQGGTDPADYFNGQLPTFTSLVPADGSLGPGDTLSVRVTNAAAQPLAGAPVTFRSKTGGHLLADLPEGVSAATVTVRSDTDGIATVYVKMGAN